MAIGYACIALGVHETDLKSCALKNADENRLRQIIELNLNVLKNMIDYNKYNNIRLFRISSDIIPFGSHTVNKIRWWEDYGDELGRIGENIKNAGIRVSMHPGQYSVLNSPDAMVVKKTIQDLEYHNQFLDSLKVDSSCKIVLHIGGVYGNKEEAITRFKKRYESLDHCIKKRLVIENDERCFNIDDVLKIGLDMNIPVILDNLHHQVNPPDQDLCYIDWLNKCSSTWNREDGKQKIHYSQQADGGKPGAHSKTISIQPFLSFYNDIDSDIDIMLETKDKNISALKCIYCTEKMDRKYIEREWARYKYLVMSKSGTIYKKITDIFREYQDTQGLTREFYKLVEEAIDINVTQGGEENAALHIWGYFKKYASEKEKDEFDKRFERFKNDNSYLRLLKKFLWRMVNKYKVDYLIESYYFL